MEQTIYYGTDYLACQVTILGPTCGVILCLVQKFLADRFISTMPPVLVAPSFTHHVFFVSSVLMMQLQPGTDCFCMCECRLVVARDPYPIVHRQRFNLASESVP